MKKTGTASILSAKLISPLVIAVTITIGFTACASVQTGDKATAETTTQAETQPSETDVVSVLNSFENINYDGASFNIWTSNAVNSTLTLRQAPDETENGEPINDALYKRDRLIEDKYNIKINYTLFEIGSLFDKASEIIMAGDDEIDVMFGNMRVYARAFIENGLILDMNKIPGIDLSKEWWHQRANQGLEINGVMYFATGDITPRYIYSPFLMMFNKQLFDDYNYEYPYAAVREGTWTLDMMQSLIKDKYRDLNNNIERDFDDFYGFANEGWAYPMYSGFGESLLSIGSGEPVLTCDNVNAIDKMMKLGEFFSTPDVNHINWHNVYDSNNIFKADRAIFSMQSSSDLYLFTDMETDYGILPLPKYDETQDRYYSFVNGSAATAIMIPITVRDTARVGTLTEAMAAASRYTSTPAAYEVTQLTKQTRDEDSVEMLRLVASTARYDLCAFLDWGSICTTVDKLILEGGKNATSRIQAVSSKAIAAAQTMLEQVSSGK